MIKVRVIRVKGTVYRDNAQSLGRQVSKVQVTSMTRQIFNQASIDCPVDTGNLRNHHRMRISDQASRTKGTVYNDAKYAAIVHNGGKTPPHTIRARRKKALAFSYRGDQVIVKSVRHPGSKVKPRPWLQNAARKVATRNGWKFQEAAS